MTEPLNVGKVFGERLQTHVFNAMDLRPLLARCDP